MVFLLATMDGENEWAVTLKPGHRNKPTPLSIHLPAYSGTCAGTCGSGVCGSIGSISSVLNDGSK